MGIEGIIVLLLVAAVLVLLVLEKVGIDAIGIGLIVVLVLLGYVIKIFDPDFVPAVPGRRKLARNQRKGPDFHNTAFDILPPEDKLD